MSARPLHGSSVGRGFAHETSGGGSIEWYTPAWIFASLGLYFDLDPCSPVAGPNPYVPATRFYTAREDGLTQPWEGRVWLNPPYGKEAGAWVEKLADHGDGIALVFSRTDVRWWHRVVPRASAVCFIEGRLTFVAGAGQSAPGNSGGPSALLAFGDECADALRASGLGIVYASREAVTSS